MPSHSLETPGAAPRQPAAAPTHEHTSPGDIAVGVVIGRTSEYFDFSTFSSLVGYEIGWLPSVITLASLKFTIRILLIQINEVNPDFNHNFYGNIM